MLPKYHILLGFIFTILILFLFPNLTFTYLIIIFLSSILIDIDHFVYYIFKRKSFNFFKAYKWYSEDSRFFESLPKEQKKKLYFGFYALHGIEFLAILFLLGFFYSQFFLAIFFGLLFHIFIDFIWAIKKQQPLHKFSWIYSFKERKKQDYFSYKREMIHKE